MAKRGISRFLAVAVLATIFIMQISSSRGHLRHHRGDSHCSRCAPGWGVVERCRRGRDTLCAECQPGTYSPHHGTQPCWICSRCGPGLYEARRCSASADTICDSCHRRPAGDQQPGGDDANDDYKRKCEKDDAAERFGVFLAPEDARSTGEQSEMVNEDVELPEDLEREREKVLWEDAQAQMREDEAKINAVQATE